MTATEFDTALLNIASAKRRCANPDDIVGIIFAYESTDPTVSNLDQWFKRSGASSLENDPIVGPNIISFFRRELLLVRMNSAAEMDVGTDYHRVVHSTKIAPIDEEVKQGWQLKLILASIFSICERREVLRGGRPPTTSAVRELLLFSGAVPSLDYFSFGSGGHNLDRGSTEVS